MRENLIHIIRELPYINSSRQQMDCAGNKIPFAFLRFLQTKQFQRVSHREESHALVDSAYMCSCGPFDSSVECRSNFQNNSNKNRLTIDELAEYESVYFWIWLFENFSVKSCTDHLKELKVEYARKLNVGVSKIEGLMDIIIHFRLENYEPFRPVCNFCKGKAVYFGITVRPNNTFMTVYSLGKLDSGLVEALNIASRDISGKKGKKAVKDLLAGIHSKLNPYVHADIGKEPDLEEWKAKYMLPLLKLPTVALKKLNEN